MVFKPTGLREGSTGRDPTAVYEVPNRYMNLFQAIGAHGQTYLIRHQDCRRNCRITIQNMSVKNFDASAFGVVADNMFDAEITGAPVHTLIDTYLHFFIANQNAVGGNSITMMAPAAFFNRQEVMANGSFSDDTIYPEQMYHDYHQWLAGNAERSARALSVGMETKDRPTNDTNLNTTNVMFDEAAAAIAPQASREYFFPIINFMTQTSLWLCSKLVDPKFRFFSAINPVLSTNNAADITTTNIRFRQMELIFMGIMYEAPIREKINTIFKSGVHYTRTLVHDRQVQAINSIAIATYLTDLQLTVFSGEYAMFLLSVSRNDATREGQIYGCNRTWTATTGSPLSLDKVTFNDSSGYPILYNDFPADFLRYCVEPSLLKYPSVNSVKAYYPFYFCTDPTTTLQTGISSGGMAMDGNFIIRFQLKNFTTGATVSVNANIIGKRYAILQLRADGSFIVTKL